MKLFRSIGRLSVLTAIAAVLLIAAPGYSWNGDRNRGDGGYYSQRYQHNNDSHSNRYSNDHGRRYNRHGSWDRHYGGAYYPHHRTYHRSYYYPYYAPSVYLGFPFPFFFPGFSFYVGP